MSQVQTQIQNLEKNIKSYRAAILKKRDDSIKLANNIIKIIEERGYNNEDLCQRIIVQNYDEILSLQALLGTIYKIKDNGIRYKLGLSVKTDSNKNILIDEPNKVDIAVSSKLVRVKKDKCDEIVKIYSKKIEILGRIITEINGELEEKCIKEEGRINIQDYTKLSDAEKKNLWTTLKEFNRKINEKYDLIQRQINEIRFVKNYKILEDFEKKIFKNINETKNMCNLSMKSLEKYIKKKSFDVPLTKGEEVPPPPPALKKIRDLGDIDTQENMDEMNYYFHRDVWESIKNLQIDGEVANKIKAVYEKIYPFNAYSNTNDEEKIKYDEWIQRRVKGILEAKNAEEMGTQIFRGPLEFSRPIIIYCTQKPKGYNAYFIKDRGVVSKNVTQSRENEYKIDRTIDNPLSYFGIFGSVCETSGDFYIRETGKTKWIKTNGDITARAAYEILGSNVRSLDIYIGQNPEEGKVSSTKGK